MNHLSFLQLVANDLYNRFGNNMSSIALVFPNKRAHLFFNEALSRCSNTPIWAPTYFTISELFHSFSSLTVCDPILAVCELHRSYGKYMKNPEALDAFYGWGERLLNDFDDLDRQMVDTEALFQNIKAIKEIEADSSLDAEKAAVLSQFFKTFSAEKNSYIKQRFLDMWEQMLPIYDDFNRRLCEQGLAYEGAINRKVATELEDDKLSEKTGRFSYYAFVGFNVLTQSEKKLFEYFQKKEQGIFYWDVDMFYLHQKHSEAGWFMRQNLDRFPNALAPENFDNLLQKKEICYVASSSLRAETQYAGQWLQNHLCSPENKTAVVLCDENLLQPLLHSLPDNIGSVNITNGFPMYQTSTFFKIEQYFSEHLHDEVRNAEEQLNVLANLLQQLQNEAILCRLDFEKKVRPSTDEQRSFQFQSESLFQAYTLLNRMSRYIQDGKLEVNLQTLVRLIRQTLRKCIIPYHGEPITGLQIMGLLETRCLDFEQLIFLSANEGILPNTASDNSFIPYFIRKAYGMTLPEHRVSIMAYYFYRLIQRCKHCTLVYTESQAGRTKGEMSRFMTQLLVETNLPIQRFALESEIRPEVEEPPVIYKSPAMLDNLTRLSPTALNTFLSCPLRFYFQQIARLKSPEIKQDIIEPDTFGLLFHKAAELTYTALTRENPIITEEVLDTITGNKGTRLINFVRQAFVEEGVAPQLVVEEVLRSYLLQLLENDKKLTPFEVVEMEKWHDTNIDFQANGEHRSITVGGIVDRIDRISKEDGQGNKRQTLRVVDYKTGGKPEEAKNMEELTEEKENRPHYIFQAFIYSMILCEEENTPVAPALFFVHKSASDDYNPYIRFGEKKEAEYISDFRPLANDFRDVLQQLLGAIFDLNTPFKATDSDKRCRSCPFVTLCGRQ